MIIHVRYVYLINSKFVYFYPFMHCAFTFVFTIHMAVYDIALHYEGQLTFSSLSTTPCDHNINLNNIFFLILDQFSYK